MLKIFGSIAELPPGVRRRLSEIEQRQFRRVFNRVFRQTNGDQAAKEAAAFRFANGAIARTRNSKRLLQEPEPVEFAKRIAIEKIDDEQRMVWGWAYLCQDEHGAQVVDHSGQIVELADIHKAAHQFMLDSRVGGQMHDERAGSVAESLVVTDAVAAELGMATRKRGWFIGFHVADQAAWLKVKDGTFQAFSIGGTADVEDL